MNWIKLDSSSIPEADGVRKAKVGGKQICIIRDQGEVYASATRCPHAGADLAGGWCEDGRLICPRHRHAFDLQTGRGDKGQGDYITTYPIERREGSWYVGLRESWLGKLFKR